MSLIVCACATHKTAYALRSILLRCFTSLHILLCTIGLIFIVLPITEIPIGIFYSWVLSSFAPCVASRVCLCLAWFLKLRPETTVCNTRALFRYSGLQPILVAEHIRRDRYNELPFTTWLKGCACGIHGGDAYHSSIRFHIVLT